MSDDGLKDAAVFVMSLGEAEAAEVFKHLSPKEVQKLGEAISKTKSLTRERVEEVVGKFTHEAASQNLSVSDSGDYVRNVLKRALGDDKAAKRAFPIWVMETPKMRPDRTALLHKLVEGCEGSYGHALKMMLELADEQEDQRRRGATQA